MCSTPLRTTIISVWDVEKEASTGEEKDQAWGVLESDLGEEVSL